MSKCICLDTSVLVKTLVEEHGSKEATALFRQIIERGQVIVLPAFAWAEVGTVLCKKRRQGILSARNADALWSEFRRFPGIEYVDGDAVLSRAWEISRHFDLPTIYDAAFLAVAEVVAEKTGEACAYWTADRKLADQVRDQKNYVQHITVLS